MIQLTLPPYQIRVKETHGRKPIFDILRRKYVALTPEEWVRQHFIHYLVEHKNYPSSLLANEVSLQIGEKRMSFQQPASTMISCHRLSQLFLNGTQTIKISVFLNLQLFRFWMKQPKVIVRLGLFTSTIKTKRVSCNGLKSQALK